VVSMLLPSSGVKVGPVLAWNGASVSFSLCIVLPVIKVNDHRASRLAIVTGYCLEIWQSLMVSARLNMPWRL
jgi:hypothetical protein